MSKIANALATTGFDFTHFAWSHAPSSDYGVWAEEYGTELKAGDIVVEQVMNGYVDYFTRDDSDAPRTTIQNAMTNAGIVWHLDTVQYEEDTGYIHYTWEYHEHGDEPVVTT